jgi:hypothetical protein
VRALSRVLWLTLILLGAARPALAQGHAPEHPPATSPAPAPAPADKAHPEPKPVAASKAVAVPATDATAANALTPEPRTGGSLGALPIERGTSRSGQPTVVVRLPKAARAGARPLVPSAAIPAKTRPRPYRLQWRVQLDWSTPAEPLQWTAPEGR